MSTVILVALVRTAFCSDRYKLTTVLIEAPAAAHLTIDGRSLEWCKHEYNGAVGCSLSSHDGVRVYQWSLRSSMTVPLQVELLEHRATFEITGEDPDFFIGYQVLDEFGQLVMTSVDPGSLR